MLKETIEEKEIRIFNHYKNRLEKESSGKIRFNGVEYLCYFPKIDPFKMAAAIVQDRQVSEPGSIAPAAFYQKSGVKKI